MQPAETPRIYSEFCGAVSNVWHLWRVKGWRSNPLQAPAFVLRVAGAVVCWACPALSDLEDKCLLPFADL